MIRTLTRTVWNNSTTQRDVTGFGGSAQELENWSSVFEGVSDFRAELIASSQDGEVESGES
jgi:hypothetical protein